jgi:hypothetical protein
MPNSLLRGFVRPRVSRGHVVHARILGNTSNQPRVLPSRVPSMVNPLLRSSETEGASCTAQHGTAHATDGANQRRGC